MRWLLCPFYGWGKWGTWKFEGNIPLPESVPCYTAYVLCSAQLRLTLCDPMDQAPPSMEFFRQEYLIRLPFSSSIFPTQGSTLRLLHLLHWQVDSLSLCHPGILSLGNFLLKLSAATQEFCFPSLHSKVTPKFGGLKQQPFYEISWFYGQWLSWVILCSMEDQTDPKRVVLGWSQVHPPEYHPVWTSTERSLRLHHLPGPQMGTAGRWSLLSPLPLLEVPGPLLGSLSWVVTRLQGDAEQGPRWKLSFICRSGLAGTTSAVGACSRQAQASWTCVEGKQTLLLDRRTISKCVATFIYTASPKGLAFRRLSQNTILYILVFIFVLFQKVIIHGRERE